MLVSLNTRIRKTWR